MAIRFVRTAVAGAVAASVLAAGFAGAPAQAAATYQDFVANGGFEGGTAAGWHDLGVVASVVTTADAHSGQYSLATTGAFDITDSPNSISPAQNAALDWVRADFWVKGPAGLVVQSSIRQYAGSASTGSGGPGTDQITLTGGWDHLVGRADHLVHDPGVDFNISAPGAGPADTVYIDDVHLYGGTDTVACGRPNPEVMPSQDSIENCSFEDPWNLTYWNNGPDGAKSTLSLDTAQAHLGSQSAKLTANVAGTITLNDSPDSRNPLQPGGFPASLTTCTATAWVMSSAGHGQAKIRLREYSATNAYVGGDVTSLTPAPGVWQQISVTHALSAGHSTGSLDLSVYATSQSVGDTLNVDDVHETCS